MELAGTFTFLAPRAAVWEALMDPAVLAQALPGGEQLEKTGANEYDAAMNVRVGPVQGKFAGKVELLDMQAPQSYRMKVSGAGPAGFVDGAGAITLQDEGDSTTMNYTGDVQVGGKIASVGQRLIESTAKSVIRQGLKVLDAQIQARLAPAVAPESLPAQAEQAADSASERKATITPQPATEERTPPPPASTASAGAMAAEIARDVARDLASDYLPLEHQEKVLYAILGALGMLLFVILVRAVQRD